MTSTLRCSRPGFLRWHSALGIVVALLLGGCAHPRAESAPPAAAAEATQDAFVLLSGGGSPTSNQYSQYLQAQAMAGYLKAKYPPESVWVFFGMGHRPGVPAQLSDVHRKYKRDGRLLSTWLPGELPDNRPATRASVLAALKDEILPRVASGGTLYLFVGDHGELTTGDARESAITLWQLEPRKEGGWRTNNAEILTVTDLRAVLAEGLGRGRVVFCMTQCHAGGFHFLGVPRRFTGNPAWYRDGRAPAAEGAWADSLGDIRIAGFTATDEASLAAGCSPDPDPDRWAGYERFVPEALTGRDLLDGKAKGSPTPAFVQAHEAATLVDTTIDKPRGTSDQFLLGWADWIESAAASPDDLVPAVRKHLGVYFASLDGNLPAGIKDRAFRERQARFARFTAAFAATSKATAKALANARHAELEKTLGPEASRPGSPRRNRTGGSSDARKAWTDVIRPAWQQAVDAGQVPGVTPAALTFEKFLLRLEAKGSDLSSAGSTAAVLNWTYWQSSLAFPQKLDPAKAEAVTRWAVERRWAIGEWARQSADPAVRAAAAKWAPRSPPGLPRPRTATDRVNPTALERELIQRRILGAWAFLLAVDDPTVLRHLQALIAVENTALPAPGTMATR